MKPFLKDTLERAIKTFAQAAVGALGAGATGLIGVDWVNILSIAGFAAVVSVLTSVGSFNIGEDTASAIKSQPKVEGEAK